MSIDLSADQGEEQGQEGPDASSLCWSEQASVDTTYGDNDDPDHGARLPRRLNSLCEPKGWPRWAEFGIDAGLNIDRQYKQGRQENPRHHSCEEQAADGFFSQDCIDDKAGAGRNQNPQCTTGGNTTGGKPWVVMVAAHLRQ